MFLRSTCCGRFGARRAAPAFLNRDVIYADRAIRLIVGIATHTGDLLHQRHRGIVALAEDRIVPIEGARLLSCERHFSDKELRSIRVRTSIGVRQTSGLVERQVGRDLVLERLDRICARACARRISALNHEARNYAVEDGAVVERHAMLGRPAHRILPILSAGSEPDEVRNPDRRLIREQCAVHLPRSGIDDGSRFRRRRRC
jgi:hypothetical protein